MDANKNLKEVVGGVSGGTPNRTNESPFKAVESEKDKIDRKVIYVIDGRYVIADSLAAALKIWRTWCGYESDPTCIELVTDYAITEKTR